MLFPNPLLLHPLAVHLLCLGRFRCFSGRWFPPSPLAASLSRPPACWWVDCTCLWFSLGFGLWIGRPAQRASARRVQTGGDGAGGRHFLGPSRANPFYFTSRLLAHFLILGALYPRARLPLVFAPWLDIWIISAGTGASRVRAGHLSRLSDPPLIHAVTRLPGSGVCTAARRRTPPSPAELPRARTRFLSLCALGQWAPSSGPVHTSRSLHTPSRAFLLLSVPCLPRAVFASPSSSYGLPPRTPACMLCSDRMRAFSTLL